MDLRIAAAAGILVLAAGAATAADICEREGACEDATTTQEIASCIGGLADEADAKLNRLWPKVLALYDDVEDSASATDTLRGAQRDWISYRDGTCEVEAALADGGSIASIYAATCMCSVTEARVEDFERMIANRSEGN